MCKAFCEKQRNIILEKHYFNPSSQEIISFVTEIKKNTSSIDEIIENILRWFEENIEYSRLSSPYYPLVRNDIDVLNLREGTCGDYSNLLVSCLINLNIPVKYAYVKRDCYGDPQDHICVAAEINTKWILIDPTLPYRNWNGVNCLHKEYQLYEPIEFQRMIKKEELCWYDKALKLGNSKLAGLFFAPWIHDEKILQTNELLESVFFLLTINNIEDWKLWINYLVYTPDNRMSPVRMLIDQRDEMIIQFCLNESFEIWNEERWGEEHRIDNIPISLKSEYYFKLIKCVNLRIDEIKSLIVNLD